MSGSTPPVIDIEMTTPSSSSTTTTTTKLTTPTQVAVTPPHTSERQKRPLTSTDKIMPKEKKEKKDKEQDKKDKKSKSTVSKSLSPLLSPGISLMNTDEERGNKAPDEASGGCEDGVLGKILGAMPLVLRFFSTKVL